MRWLALLPVLATGCSVYAQQRQALVPHATPIQTDGQPLATKGELAAGVSNAMDAIAPRAGDPDAGVVIPNTQVRSSLTLRARDDVAVSGIIERGLSAGSHALAEHQPKVDNDVTGAGIGLTYSIPTSIPEWRVALSTELMMWSVPWVQYTTCIQNCYGSTETSSTTGSDMVPTLAVGITPSYRSGRLTLFGGATARNHPTVDQTIRTNLPQQDPDVQAGSFNLTLHAGAEISFAGGIRASVIVHQTVTSDPVIYGPGFGMMITVPFGPNT